MARLSGGLAVAPQLLALCQRSLGRPDGIRDYTVRLVKALSATGSVHAELLWRDDNGRWGVAGDLDEPGQPEAIKVSLLQTLANCDVVLLQYNPFMYGRWGFAPWLPLVLLRLRLSRKRPRIALMVHEPFVPMVNWRWTLMGIWQRLQLMILRFSADVVFASIEAWADRFRAVRPRRPTHHLPVGSNVPDGRRFRTQQRLQIGADDGSIVLATFGQYDPARLQRCIVEAGNSLADAGRRVIILNLGASAAPLVGLDNRVVVHSPGSLPAGQVAQWLSAADIYLGPFADGASTRRTTLMAAMQNGLPIVATDGPLTDTILRTSGALQLVPVNRLDQFAHTVRQLAESQDDRRALGVAARSLYRKQFDWPVAATRLLRMLRHTSGLRLVKARHHWAQRFPDSYLTSADVAARASE